MIQIPRYPGMALICLALASCGSSDSDEDTRQLSAGGKILEGSISDDMLPYDTLRSEAPRAKRGSTAPDKESEGSTAQQAEAEQPVVTDSALPDD